MHFKEKRPRLFDVRDSQTDNYELLFLFVKRIFLKKIYSVDVKLFIYS